MNLDKIKAKYLNGDIEGVARGFLGKFLPQKAEDNVIKMLKGEAELDNSIAKIVDLSKIKAAYQAGDIEGVARGFLGKLVNKSEEDKFMNEVKAANESNAELKDELAKLTAQNKQRQQEKEDKEKAAQEKFQLEQKLEEQKKLAAKFDEEAKLEEAEGSINLEQNSNNNPCQEGFIEINGVCSLNEF